MLKLYSRISINQVPECLRDHAIVKNFSGNNKKGRDTSSPDQHLQQLHKGSLLTKLCCDNTNKVGKNCVVKFNIVVFGATGLLFSFTVTKGRQIHLLLL